MSNATQPTLSRGLLGIHGSPPPDRRAGRISDPSIRREAAHSPHQTLTEDEFDALVPQQLVIELACVALEIRRITDVPVRCIRGSDPHSGNTIRARQLFCTVAKEIVSVSTEQLAAYANCSIEAVEQFLNSISFNDLKTAADVASDLVSERCAWEARNL